ncbi:MAG TPA: NAD-dependent epimerase/dehydratase family protein [Pseudomonadales bacterium]|nr:NAD-dependent epimerase/dehydratase family protein [Pseudomonadales bacterium]
MLQSDIDEIASRLREAAPALAGKTILLTGGRGFLGRYFTHALVRLNATTLKKSPCKMIVLDNLITAGKEGSRLEKLPHCRIIKHDIVKPFKIAGNVHYILHAAGIASPFYYRAYPLQTLEVATAGTKHMLEAAKKHRARVLFFSSSEIYGDPDPRFVPIQESYRGNVSCQGPRACYDESKRLGETLCYIYHELHGVSVSTVRPFNVFGPGMQEADYRVLPNFANRIKGNQPLHIYGTGNQTRTFCYITDAIVGFLLAMIKGVPGEAYNIGNPEPELSMVALADRIEKVLKRKIPRILSQYPDSYPADEPLRRCPDIRKARVQIGYEPQIDFDEGLRRFFAWTDTVYTGKQP